MAFSQHKHSVDTDALVRLPLPAILADHGYQVQQTGKSYFSASHPKERDDVMVYHLPDGRWGYKNRHQSDDKGNALNFLMHRGQSFLSAAHTLEDYQTPAREKYVSSVMQDLDARYTQSSRDQLAELQTIPIGEIAESHGWSRDDKESTPTWEKYRSPAGDSIVVNPQKNFYFHQQDKDADKGGVIQFMQKHILPGASLGDVRKALQPLTGEMAAWRRPVVASANKVVDLPVISDHKEAWRALPPLSDRSREYLTQQRGLSDETLDAYAASIRTDVHTLPSGHAFGGGQLHNVAFAHFAMDKDGHAVLSGWEKKGPGKDRTFTGFNGNKGIAVFRHKDFNNAQERDAENVGFCQHLILCESSIDALSKAQMDGLHPGDLYVSMGGTPSAAGEKALDALIRKHAPATIVLAFDQDDAGRAFTALMQQKLDQKNDRWDMPLIQTRTVFPEIGKDWNDQLRKQQEVTRPVPQNIPHHAPARAVNDLEIG